MIGIYDLLLLLRKRKTKSLHRLPTCQSENEARLFFSFRQGENLKDLIGFRTLKIRSNVRLLADTKWQRCKNKMIFTFKFSKWCFEVTKYGLMNAPLTFPIKMHELLEERAYARDYFDDVSVLSKEIGSQVKYLLRIAEQISVDRLGLRLEADLHTLKDSFLGMLCPRTKLMLIQRRLGRYRKLNPMSQDILRQCSGSSLYLPES